MNEIEILPPKESDLVISAANIKEIIPHFTKEEMNYLLSRVPPGKLGMLFQFLWRTGVRVTEAVSLLKKDIDFGNSVLTIRWLKNRKFNYRVIPLHNSLKQPLYLFTAGMKAEDRIFSITRQRVDQLCKKHKFNHAHMFRHSFAINFLRQSKSPMALVMLKNLLGHADIKTTMEYLKVVPMEMKKSMEEILFD